MKNITLKDIYAGKPDAKDEIVFNGIDDFLETLIVPSNFNLDGIVAGDKFFITGLKGTGKTALIFHIDALLREQDKSACTSFIFFNTKYSEIKRKEINNFSRQITSSITMDGEVLLGGEEYEYIWKWLLFNRICADNEECSEGLFVNDENWETFVNLINKIHAPNDKRKSVIPQSVRLGIGVTNGTTTVKPEIEIDFRNLKNNGGIDQFIAIIDEADKAFQNVKRTDIPYYIFIDELEAYYGDRDVFLRDLRMLRDLIFAVKYFNTLFFVNGMVNTKIICSIRTEILEAISRFVVTKEVNKAIDGFVTPLTWNYTNTNSANHPILQILLRRIMIAEGDTNQNFQDVYERWLPEKINNTYAANYILNNSWNKPRDIVRLVKTAQDSLHHDSCMFSQAVFDSIRKDYSKDSLEEIKEELRALYKTEDLNQIINCFMGYESVFSYSEIQERIKQYFSGSILDTNTTQVFQDLFRTGFIGNYSKKTRRYRWNHKGDGEIIISPDWDIMIHRALQPALSSVTAESKKRKAKATKQTKHDANELISGQAFDAIVLERKTRHIIVKIVNENEEYKGSFKIKDSMFTDDAHTKLKYNKGDSVTVQIINYNSKFQLWNVAVVG